MINLQECVRIIVQKTTEQLDTFGRCMVEQYLRGQDVRSMNDIESLSRRLFGRTSTLPIKDEQSTANKSSKSDRKDGKINRRGNRKPRSKKKKKKKSEQHSTGQAVESRDDMSNTIKENSSNRRNRRKKRRDTQRRTKAQKKGDSVRYKESPPLCGTGEQKEAHDSTHLWEGNDEETSVVSSSTQHELIPLCRPTGRHEFCADTEKFLNITCRFCGEQRKTPCESVHAIHLDYLLARRKRRFIDHLPYDLSLPLSPHTHIDIQSMMVAAGVVARVDIAPCVILVEGLPESDPYLFESIYEALLLDTRGFITGISTLPTEFPSWHTVIAKVQIPAWDQWSQTHAPYFPFPQWPTLRISLGLVSDGSYAVQLLTDFFAHNNIIFTSPDKMLFTCPDFPKIV